VLFFVPNKIASVPKAILSWLSDFSLGDMNVNIALKYIPEIKKT